MATAICRGLSFWGYGDKSRHDSYDVDDTIALRIEGTHQRVRLCAGRTGLPPVLIVQAGPGFPLLNEASKFQQRLRLEQDFSVAYWEQRGCGPAALRDIQKVSLETQVDDLCAVIRWLAEKAGQQVVVLGISLGATMALEAAVRETACVKAVVAVSIDANTATSDASALSFLQEKSNQAGQRKLARSAKKLETPPYTTPSLFQLRARLLTDLGGMEHGKRFGELLRSLLCSLVRTYGWFGAATALRNMNAIQRRLLPELAGLNLFTNWPRSVVPVHYVFGYKDPLISRSLVHKICGVVGHHDTFSMLPNAGHMVHFDEPAAVRALVVQAHASS